VARIPAAEYKPWATTLEAACANAASGPAPTPDRRVSAIDVPTEANMTGGAVPIVALAPTPLLGGHSAVHRRAAGATAAPHA
jgi:hypothetical protein